MRDTLGFLIGRWQGEEQIATTRWGQGGPAKGFIQARIDLGGRALVQDYREERDGKLTLQAHAVFGLYPAARVNDVQRHLPGLTGGEGVLESTFAGYEPVGPGEVALVEGAAANDRDFEGLEVTGGGSEPTAAAVDNLLAVAAARAADVQRAVLVRAAVCDEVAQRAARSLSMLHCCVRG